MAGLRRSAWRAASRPPPLLLLLPRLSLVLAACLAAWWLPASAGGQGAGCSAEDAMPTGAASTLAASGAEEASRGAAQAAAAERFFAALDGNGDGQIESHEARSYVAGLEGEEFDTTEEVARAVAELMGDLDSADKDSSVSLAEFMAHMERMLQGSRVSDWIQHGLELPQYAALFKENAITIGDFPLLVGPDGPSILETDLKVESRLHRERITRVIKQQMLGLGHAPSQPQDVSCEVLECNIVVNWQRPADVGGPAFHKYVVEHRIMNVAGWAAVGETAADDTQWVAVGLEAGKYEFRVTAWNRAGRSQYGISGACLLPVLECTGGGFSREQPKPVSLPVAADRAAGEGQLSFWVWMNSGLSAAVYVAVILIKHTAQDPSFRGRIRCRVAAFGPVRFAARLTHRLSQLEEWAEQSAERVPSARLEHSDSLALAQLSHSQPDADTGSEQAGISSEAAPWMLPYAMDEEPSPDVIHGLTNGLYPKGFPVELVAPVSPLRPLLSTDRESLGSRSASQLEDLALDFHKTHKSGLKLDAEASLRRPQSSSHVSSERLHPSENGSGRSASGDTRFRCAHPGCTRSWDKWHNLKNLRRMAHSHYCGSCQRSFCGHHTRISPHGPTGSCGMDSACLCMHCFSRLPSDAQAAALARNKLPAKHVSKVASSQGTGTSCGGSDVSANQISNMQEKIADLDSHLSHIRGEANWAKARSKISAVGKFISSGKKSNILSKSSRRGLPPAGPTASSPDSPSKILASERTSVTLARAKKAFSRDASPLKRNSLTAAAMRSDKC